MQVLTKIKNPTIFIKVLIVTCSWYPALRSSAKVRFGPNKSLSVDKLDQLHHNCKIEILLISYATTIVSVTKTCYYLLTPPLITKVTFFVCKERTTHLCFPISSSVEPR